MRESTESPRCGDVGWGKFCLLRQGGGLEAQREACFVKALPGSASLKWGPAEQLSKGPLIVHYCFMCERFENEQLAVFLKKWLPQPLFCFRRALQRPLLSLGAKSNRELPERLSEEESEVVFRVLTTTSLKSEVPGWLTRTTGCLSLADVPGASCEASLNLGSVLLIGVVELRLRAKW